MNSKIVWIPTANMALRRVKERVKKGGHSIEDHVVRRRYVAGLRNFFSIYQDLADSWVIFDNSEATPQKIASNEKGQIELSEKAAYAIIVRKAAKNER